MGPDLVPLAPTDFGELTTLCNQHLEPHRGLFSQVLLRRPIRSVGARICRVFWRMEREREG